MDTTPAVVLTHHHLRTMLDEVAEKAANKAVANLKTEIRTDPNELIVERLRAYLADRTTEADSREVWAHSGHIRQLELNRRGQPKSVAWFQGFKRVTGLRDCPSRASKQHGRLREWCFEDIANAWVAYYGYR